MRSAKRSPVFSSVMYSDRLGLCSKCSAESVSLELSCTRAARAVRRAAYHNGFRRFSILRRRSPCRASSSDVCRSHRIWLSSRERLSKIPSENFVLVQADVCLDPDSVGIKHLHAVESLAIFNNYGLGCVRQISDSPSCISTRCTALTCVGAQV
jgi:hypothetical protein